MIKNLYQFLCPLNSILLPAKTGVLLNMKAVPWCFTHASGMLEHLIMNERKNIDAYIHKNVCLINYF